MSAETPGPAGGLSDDVYAGIGGAVAGLFIILILLSVIIGM